MDAFLLSFIAGILTVLAPCVLPILPFFLAGKSWKSSAMIVLGLSISIFFFTLIIRTGTLFFDVPDSFWKQISAGIILLFALTLLFPSTWEKVSKLLGFSNSSQNIMNTASQKEGLWGRFFLGASLAPVFSSCSPTYFIILGTVLPQSFSLGILHLLVYILGLALIFLAIAIGGHSLVKKIAFASDPHGIFKKFLGIIFLMLSVLLFTGLDKKAEGWLLQQEWYWNSAEIEQSVSESLLQ